ncbi:hypothetical protein [Saccharopolyspora hattusasensis]|uniref:WXG100-like domain-containing protein n=1 Tax=Saccharopolyspora hattusasensis TaxID=1128679 RepID=UPI003D996653
MFSSIMVPEGVRRLFQVLTGEDMTDADEGALFAVADALESGAAELGEVRGLVAELVGKVRTEFSGKAADRFADGLGIFDGLLSSGQAGLLDLAAFVRKTSQQVRYLKLVTIYGLELLAVEMAWAMYFAGATAGATLAWLAARMAVMRFLLTSWWRQLFMRLAMMAAGGVVFNVVPDLQAQVQMLGEESAQKWDGTLTEQAAGMGAFSALVALPMSALGGLVSNTLTKVLVKGLGDDVDAAILEAAAKKAVAEHAELYPVSAMAKFADAVGKSLDDYAGMSVGAMWLARFGHSVGEALENALSEFFGEALYAAATGQKVTWNPFSLTAGFFETVFSGVGNLAGLALRGKLHPEGPSPYLESTGRGGDGSDDGGGTGGEKTPLPGAGSGSQTGDIPGTPDKNSTFIPSDAYDTSQSDASDASRPDGSRWDGWAGSDSGAGPDSSSMSDVDSVFSDTGSVDSAAVSVSSGDGLVVPGSAVVSAVVMGGTDGKDGKDGTDGTDGKRGADGGAPGRDAAGDVPVVPGAGQHRPGTPPPAYSGGVPGVDPDRPGTPPPPYSPVAGGDQAVPGKRPLEVSASKTPDFPTVTPHASDVPADAARPETVRPGSVVGADGRVPAGHPRSEAVGSGSVVGPGSGVPAGDPVAPGGVAGRDGDPGTASVAGRGDSHCQDGPVVSAGSVTLSGEGSPAASSLHRDPVAVLPVDLPADTVRVPVTAEVVAGGGLAKFVQGVADSMGGPVLLVSDGDPTAGVVVTPGQGSALARDLGRHVVAMMPGQDGREPRFMVFPADGSRPKPLAGPGAAVLTGGRSGGVAGLADASATVPAAGGKTVAGGEASATGTGSAQQRSVFGEGQPAETPPDAGAGTVRDISRIPVGQWTQEELASAIAEARKLDLSRDEKETAGQIVRLAHDVAVLARGDAAVPLRDVVALVAAKYRDLGDDHRDLVVEFSQALADRLRTRGSRPVIRAGSGAAVPDGGRGGLAVLEEDSADVPAAPGAAPVGQWSDADVLEEIKRVRLLGLSSEEKDAVRLIVQRMHDPRMLAGRGDVSVDDVVTLVAARRRALGGDWGQVEAFSRELAERLGTVLAEGSSGLSIRAGAGPVGQAGRSGESAAGSGRHTSGGPSQSDAAAAVDDPASGAAEQREPKGTKRTRGAVGVGSRASKRRKAATTVAAGIDSGNQGGEGDGSAPTHQAEKDARIAERKWKKQENNTRQAQAYKEAMARIAELKAEREKKRESGEELDPEKEKELAELEAKVEKRQQQRSKSNAELAQAHKARKARVAKLTGKREREEELDSEEEKELADGEPEVEKRQQQLREASVRFNDKRTADNARIRELRAKRKEEGKLNPKEGEELAEREAKNKERQRKVREADARYKKRIRGEADRVAELENWEKLGELTPEGQDELDLRREIGRYTKKKNDLQKQVRERNGAIREIKELEALPQSAEIKDRLERLREQLLGLPDVAEPLKETKGRLAEKNEKLNGLGRIAGVGASAHQDEQDPMELSGVPESAGAGREASRVESVDLGEWLAQPNADLGVSGDAGPAERSGADRDAWPDAGGVGAVAEVRDFAEFLREYPVWDGSVGFFGVEPDGLSFGEAKGSSGLSIQAEAGPVSQAGRSGESAAGSGRHTSGGTLQSGAAVPVDDTVGGAADQREPKGRKRKRGAAGVSTGASKRRKAATTVAAGVSGSPGDGGSEVLTPTDQAAPPDPSAEKKLKKKEQNAKRYQAEKAAAARVTELETLARPLTKGQAEALAALQPKAKKWLERKERDAGRYRAGKAAADRVAELEEREELTDEQAKELAALRPKAKKWQEQKDNAAEYHRAGKAAADRVAELEEREELTDKQAKELAALRPKAKQWQEWKDVDTGRYRAGKAAADRVAELEEREELTDKQAKELAALRPKAKQWLERKERDAGRYRAGKAAADRVAELEEREELTDKQAKELAALRPKAKQWQERKERDAGRYRAGKAAADRVAELEEREELTDKQAKELAALRSKLAALRSKVAGQGRKKKVREVTETGVGSGAPVVGQGVGPEGVSVWTGADQDGWDAWWADLDLEGFDWAVADVDGVWVPPGAVDAGVMLGEDAYEEFVPTELRAFLNQDADDDFTAFLDEYGEDSVGFFGVDADPAEQAGAGREASPDGGVEPFPEAGLVEDSAGVPAAPGTASGTAPGAAPVGQWSDADVLEEIKRARQLGLSSEEKDAVRLIVQRTHDPRKLAGRGDVSVDDVVTLVAARGRELRGDRGQVEAFSRELAERLGTVLAEGSSGLSIRAGAGPVGQAGRSGESAAGSGRHTSGGPSQSGAAVPVDDPLGDLLALSLQNLAGGAGDQRGLEEQAVPTEVEIRDRIAALPDAVEVLEVQKAELEVVQGRDEDRQALRESERALQAELAKFVPDGIAKLAELTARMERHLRTMPPEYNPNGVREKTEAAKNLVWQGPWTPAQVQKVEEELPGVEAAVRVLRDARRAKVHEVYMQAKQAKAQRRVPITYFKDGVPGGVSSRPDARLGLEVEFKLPGENFDERVNSLGAELEREGLVDWRTAHGSKLLPWMEDYEEILLDGRWALQKEAERFEVEATSPILRNDPKRPVSEQLWPSMEKLLSAVQRQGGYGSESGGHINVSFDWSLTPRQYVRVAQVVKVFEALLFRLGNVAGGDESKQRKVRNAGPISLPSDPYAVDDDTGDDGHESLHDPTERFRAVRFDVLG